MDRWNSRIGAPGPEARPGAGAGGGPACRVQPVRLGQEPAAEPGRAGRVDPPRVGRQGERGRHHRVGVEEDLAGDGLRRRHHGQHRHAGRRVVVAEPHRQRPEMRRRPQEDDREQRRGRPGDGAGDGGPADQDGEAAGRAADHDVGRGAPLQGERVHEHVEQDRARGQERRQPVDGEPEQQGRRRAEHDARGQGLGRLDAAAAGLRDQRAVRGAPHHRVDVPVQVAVEGVGAGGRERAADQGHREHPQRGQPALGQQHGGDGRDQQQLDDPRLGQLEQGPRDGARLAPRRGSAVRPLSAGAGSAVAAEVTPLPRSHPGERPDSPGRRPRPRPRPPGLARPETRSAVRKPPPAWRPTSGRRAS